MAKRVVLSSTAELEGVMCGDECLYCVFGDEVGAMNKQCPKINDRLICLSLPQGYFIEVNDNLLDSRKDV